MRAPRDVQCCGPALKEGRGFHRRSSYRLGSCQSMRRLDRPSNTLARWFLGVCTGQTSYRIACNLRAILERKLSCTSDQRKAWLRVEIDTYPLYDMAAEDNSIHVIGTHAVSNQNISYILPTWTSSPIFRTPLTKGAGKANFQFARTSRSNSNCTFVGL